VHGDAIVVSSGLADGAQPARPFVSEYHAIGAVAGAFMLRFGR